jgi:acetyltransferase
VASHSYPSQYESKITIRNGINVFIRPILPTDECLLVDLFYRLSSGSLYLRFLQPMNHLSDDMLFQLTHIDYQKNFALVALTRERGKDCLIAVARYGYDPEDKITDFAITVRDDWQHNGLGKELLMKIFAIGREHHIFRFVSIIDSTNHAIKHILRRIGYTVQYSYRKGCTQVEVLV